jgi:hypothetical protein
MSNLPKYYFCDIPADVMREIMDEIDEPELDIDAELAGIEAWLLQQR